MSNLHLHIKKARKHAGLTQQDVASACGVSRNAVTQWESMNEATRTEPSLDKLGIFAKLVGMSLGDIISGDFFNNVSPAVQQPASVPLISWVQAGSFSEAIDLHQVGTAEDYVARINGGVNVYALRVRGDSMTAPVGSTVSFPEGYIIHVDPDQSANSGDFVIAKIVGEDAVTFKQLKNGDKPYLQPLNPDHKPIFDEFRVLGKVIGVSLKL